MDNPFPDGLNLEELNFCITCEDKLRLECLPLSHEEYSRILILRQCLKILKDRDCHLHEDYIWLNCIVDEHQKLKEQHG